MGIRYLIVVVVRNLNTQISKTNSWTPRKTVLSCCGSSFHHISFPSLIEVGKLDDQIGYLSRSVKLSPPKFPTPIKIIAQSRASSVGIVAKNACRQCFNQWEDTIPARLYRITRRLVVWVSVTSQVFGILRIDGKLGS